MLNDKVINNIISEAINHVINEDFMDEKKHNKKNDNHDGIADLIKDFLHKHKKKKSKRRLRKMAGGRSKYYDYDSYKQSNKDLAFGDASSIISKIDMEKTNIAAIARELFPDHTEEGAQSQLRKILNGERPLTNKIASKLDKMIAAGKVALK